VQVREVKLLPDLNNIGVFLHIQPTHVGKEESARGVVGVGIGFGVFMVDAVVAGPVKDGPLVGDGVA